MKDYYKLAVFIAVLLLSVSLMSVAIDILGDISDVELDMAPQDEEASTVASETMDANKGKGKTTPVEGIPLGDYTPLFEIQHRPKTKYLRRTVGEVYDNGEWRLSEEHVPVLYHGEELEPVVSGYNYESVYFSIKPFFNLSGFIPATLSVVNIGFKDTLEHYPSLELFSAPEPFSSTYGVTYTKYEFSKVKLLGAKTSDYDRYLEVPEELAERLRDLALDIVGDTSTPWEQLKVLEAYLKETYEYNEEYNTEPPGIDPVDWFLFNETAGVCSHFNSAFVFLARSLDIPARVVMGFIISPEAEYQLVMPKMAHLWVEVPFEELGWMTFDATPERVEEKPIDIYRTPTVTNITYNDALAIKGGYFTVHGTVTTLNGSAVDGLSVEVFLAVRKNETGIRCGIGTVKAGVFNITCDATPSLEVGDYNLVAHAKANEVYQESWSDPPIRIMAETEVSIHAASGAYVGESVTFVGKLIDKSNGTPITNATVSLVIENETVYVTTDSMGAVSMTHTYDTEGNKTVSICMEDSSYYLGSNSTFGIAVSLPPPRHGILTMITTFPYNVILAAGAAVSIGVVILLTRKREQPLIPRVAVEPRYDLEVDEELPLSFRDYKEGIMKLFNRFYASAQRRYDDVVDSMTAREFQRSLLARIPSDGATALEYLVTAFEIADYSTSRPSKEVYEKCLAAVEMLRGRMGNG
jgi:transglutaminase-like putative cysteine protease